MTEKIIFVVNNLKEFQCKTYIKKYLGSVDYTVKINHILISTLNRNWTDSNTSAFSFPVKFNTSNTSLELRKEYSDLIDRRNVTLKKELFVGSTSLSIPIDIKNIIDDPTWRL